MTIRLTEDKGTREFTEFWQKMIDEGLVATNLTSWSDRWKSAVGQGKVASLFSGAWLPSLLMSDIPGAAGLWRVAQMPTPDGKATTSENGGSALAVLQRSRKPEASYRFIEYACHNAKGITTRVDGGAFPADKNTLSDSKFLSKTTVTDDRGIEVPYFGGQEYNRVLSQAAENVVDRIPVSAVRSVCAQRLPVHGGQGLQMVEPAAQRAEQAQHHRRRPVRSPTPPTSAMR